MWLYQRRLQRPWQTWEEFLIQRVLLLTGGDCFFSRKIQTFKLFSFLICLPLCTNQTCKYCIFESYLWIVLYRLRLATTKKKVENQDKKQEKDNSNSEKKEPCCTVSAFISRPACEWMCHSVTKQYTIQYPHTHKKRYTIRLGRGCWL